MSSRIETIEEGLELVLERLSDPDRVVKNPLVVYEGANSRTGFGLWDYSVEPERACVYGWCAAIERVYGLPEHALAVRVGSAAETMGFGSGSHGMTLALETGRHVELAQRALAMCREAVAA